MVRLKLDQPEDGIHGIEAVQSKARGASIEQGARLSPAEIHEEIDDCSCLRVVL
jgi:hypothetical protein